MKKLLIILAVGLIIAAIALKTNPPTEQGKCCADSTKIGCMDSIKAISPDSCVMKQYEELKDTVLIDSNEIEKPKGLI